MVLVDTSMYIIFKFVSFSCILLFIKNILHHNDNKILLTRHADMMFVDLRLAQPHLKNIDDLSII
jgi:hypothetical protein